MKPANIFYRSELRFTQSIYLQSRTRATQNFLINSQKNIKCKRIAGVLYRRKIFLLRVCHWVQSPVSAPLNGNSLVDEPSLRPCYHKTNVTIPNPSLSTFDFPRSWMRGLALLTSNHVIHGVPACSLRTHWWRANAHPVRLSCCNFVHTTSIP